MYFTLVNIIIFITKRLKIKYLSNKITNKITVSIILFVIFGLHKKSSSISTKNKLEFFVEIELLFIKLAKNFTKRIIQIK